MEMKTIKHVYESHGVVRITLSRPEIHNAFDDVMIHELSALLKKIHQERVTKNLRLLVLEGEGKSFCAGADLHWMKRMKNYSEEENIEDSRKLGQLFRSLNFFKCPIIGKVHGAALGGGAGLVAACDYVLASESATFGFTEVRVGLVPAVISPYVMAKIGESQARAYFLSGTKFSAQKAYEMGLVHQVVKEEKLDEEMDKVVKSFLKAGPHSSSSCKRLIFEVANSIERIRDVQEKTFRTIADLRTSPEGQEGMTALLEKRKPKWVE